MRLLTLLLALLCCQLATAQEDSPPAAEPAPVEAGSSAPEENPIPQPIPPTRYDAIFGRNPFLIVTHVDTPTGPGWAENFELRGYYSVRGVQTAVLKDRSTNKSVRITSTENKDGLRLISAKPSSKRKETTMEIAKSGETSHTFSFPATASAGATGGMPPGGMPGANPTVPGNLRQSGIPAPQPGRAAIPTPNYQNGQMQNPAQRAGIPGVSYANPAQAANPALQRPPVPGAAVPMPTGIPNPAMGVNGAQGSVPSPISRRRRILAPPTDPAQPNPVP
jgi:hypothetical protein